MDTYSNASPQGLIGDEAQAISASNRPGNNTADPRTRRLAEAERFLATLDEAAESWCFQTFDDSGQRGELARTLHGELGELFDTLDGLNKAGAGVFVTINEVPPGAPRTAANVRRVRACFADFDRTAPPEAWPLAPVLEVESSPGKRHAYWTLDGLPLDGFEPQQRGIAAALGSDPAVIDLPRVMRLPGFRHQKDPSRPAWVRIVATDERLPYRPEDLARAFPPVTKASGGERPDPGADPIAQALDARRLVLREKAGGGLFITCPWEGEHTTPSTPTSTVYYPAHTGGYAGAAFRCQHAHCKDRTAADLRRWLGLDADDWPEPEDLPEGLPPVEAFDPTLLPAALRPWIVDIAERMQCPPDYPAAAAVVCLAAVVGRQVGIRPKARDDWTVVPNLWGGVIGRPSLLKSPALAEPMKAVDALEAAARDFYAEAEKAHKAACAVNDAIVKQAQGDIQKAVKAGDMTKAEALARESVEEPEPPTRRRYKTSDATVEKLGELLRDNPRGVLVFRDELVGFLRSLDREGREGSRAFFLEAWNGTGGYTFDRIGRGTVEIEAACVSILGGIQPGLLADYLTEALRGGAGDDGLLQRFQVAVWPDPPAVWVNVDRWPDSNARQAARQIFDRLDALDPAAIGATQDEGDRLPWLRFDATAQVLFDDWRADLERRLRTEDLPPALESHLAKYRSLAPSLALLFHLTDVGRGPVGEPSLLRALAWCEYLESHARRIYSPALAPELFAARELDRRLLGLPQPFTAKDVYRNHWRSLDREGTAAALATLEDFGRVRGEKAQGPGRPTVRYTINPALRGARQ
jgi:putative DNA primase/helicase